MLFSSISFLYYFFVFVLLLYFAVPFKLKNIVLLVSSLVFYFYGEPKYVLLMLAQTLLSYIFGLLIDKSRRAKINFGNGHSKLFLILAVALNIIILGFFKYTDFFITNVNTVFNADISLLKIVLPIGISFYTFQTVSYLVDVYRGKAEVQKSFIRLATYVTLFPQLIAGPIVRYTDVEHELSERKHSFENFAYGANRFILGLSKKVLIANALGELCSTFRASDDKSVAFYWIYAISFSLHIYFDFSGYSDMAIGIGRIFGFHFLENFNYPYISKSISEFWRRWHISLGSWFRDYVYIPLGGNRVSTSKWFRNILVVWALTGFWHGAAWNFVVWGLFFAVFLIAEKLFIGNILKKIPNVFSHIYVLTAVIISFVIFNADSMRQAVGDIGGMFGASDIPFWSAETLFYFKDYAFTLLIAIIGATPLLKNAFAKLKAHPLGRKAVNIAEPVMQVALLLVITAYLVDGSFNPFLYFRF